MTTISYSSVKAFVDFVFALTLLVFLIPVSSIIMILILLDSRGSPIFIQSRIGANGRTFKIYKFRTMRIGSPNISTEEMRKSGMDLTTTFGQFLRKSSLDEVPQILNILVGDMSFVGPRPALPSQTDVLDLRKSCGVDALRPGITGLAQVKGRDNLSVRDKVAWDYEYLKKFGWKQDFEIIFIHTPFTILTGRGNQ